eukprot:scaffold98734_cov13-Prasinocladus_malaysianus.AAC.1
MVDVYTQILPAHQGMSLSLLRVYHSIIPSTTEKDQTISKDSSTEPNFKAGARALYCVDAAVMDKKSK